MHRPISLLLGFLLCAAVAQAEVFNFAALQSVMRSQSIGSVEELIAALPAAQRSRYALVFDSRSLQGATFKDPRVILYGPDARFTVTFNGDPRQRGFQTVETMEFDDDAKEFRFRELVFTARTSDPSSLAVSEVNPDRCTRCHGTPARPVWDTHPLWPGAYGERYGATPSSKERAGLAAFLSQWATHPRYRHLLAAARFADPETFRPRALRQYSGVPAEPPNAELALRLGELQLQSIAYRLARQPDFGAYQYVLLGVADNACGHIADFYPAALWRAQQAEFERFASSTSQANSRQAQLKAKRTTDVVSAAGGEDASANALLGLRFVAESALALPTDSWTLALERRTYDFTLPPSSTATLRAALLAQVAERDPRIRDLGSYATSSDGDRYCNYLQRRSRAALSQLPAGFMGATAVGTTSTPPPGLAGGLPASPVMRASSGSAATLARPAALQSCVSCHAKDGAPQLPFLDPAQLTRELHVRPSAHGVLIDEIRFRLSPQAGARRMPLGLVLPDSERQSLERYFTALAEHAD